MADPVSYSPTYSFSGYQNANPARPLPAPRVDDELANISAAHNSVVEALKGLRRADGQLQNGVVTLSALADELKVRYTGGAISAWAPVIDFAAGIVAQVNAPATVVFYSGETYVCVVAHTTTGIFVPSNWKKIAAKGANGSGSGDMLAANNLAELTNKPQALSNLGGAPLASLSAKLDTAGGVMTGAVQDLVVAPSSAPTKKATFNLAAIAAGQTRNIRVPDMDTVTGIWEPIGDYTLSAVASLVLTDLGAFRKLRISGTLTTSAGGLILMRTSSNNGASFDNGAFDYGYQVLAAAGTSDIAAPGGNSSYMYLSNTTGMDANRSYIFYGHFEGFNAAEILKYRGSGAGVANGAQFVVDVTGLRAQPIARNALQILPSTGTVTGKVTVEGFRG